MSDFGSTVVVITGGSSGIGLATARQFLQHGAAVAIAGRDRTRLDAAVQSLNGGGRLLAVAADVSNTEQVERLVRETTIKFGHVDVLVNNAGTNVTNRKFRDLTPEVWEQLVRVNLASAFLMTHAVLPGMLERQSGLIVNVNSTAGVRANPIAGAGYCAAKFGMAAMGMCLGVEERENGIRVTNIHPGEVDTPLIDVRPKKFSAEEKLKLLQPDDVAAAILFVSSLPPRAHVPELIIKPATIPFI